MCTKMLYRAGCHILQRKMVRNQLEYNRFEARDFLKNLTYGNLAVLESDHYLAFLKNGIV
jgi:hypothetical protein